MVSEKKARPPEREVEPYYDWRTDRDTVRLSKIHIHMPETPEV